MFGKLFGTLFEKKKEAITEMATLNLNAKLQPMHRTELFEKPLNKKMRKQNLGSVTGGGTLQNEKGEIENCDIEIQLTSSTTESIDALLNIMENLRLPKGSKITFEATGSTLEIGTTEGLALYLNGTDLPAEIYQTSDINIVISEIGKLLKSQDVRPSYWQGETETALYLYGTSFTEMNALISDFVNSYPLCQQCRIVQIA